MSLPVIQIPARTGETQRDLDSLYNFVEQYVAFLSVVGASTTDIINQGLGGERLLAADVSIPPVSFGAPADPTGLVATPFYDAIGLSWKVVLDPTIDGYEIQRADDALMTTNVAILTLTKGFQYLDTHLGGAGVTRSYRVRALRNNGLSSDWTSPATTTTTADTAQLVQIETWGLALQAAKLL